MFSRVLGVFLVIAAALVLTCEGKTHDFDVFRLAQFDKSTVPFGSRRANFNHLAIAPDAVDGVLGKDGDLARRVAVLRMEEVTTSMISHMIQFRNPGAILILLPESFSNIPDDTMNEWKEVEQELLSREIKIPLYFAVMDERLGEIYSTLLEAQTSVQGSDSFQLSVGGTEAAVVPTVSVRNFQGWLSGTTGSAAAPLPTIAFVAHYDTFGAAPHMPGGADSNGSGAVAVLSLARLFNNMYQGSRAHTQAAYNMLFVLTGAGKLNYAGTKDWLQTVDSRILESLELVLCLESLMASDDLYLHVSRVPSAKDPAMLSMHDALVSTADSMGVSLTTVHRKINVSEPELAWEHQQFSLKRVPAATLSARSEPAPLAAGGSMFDTFEVMERRLPILHRNVQLLAEAVARHIFALSDTSSAALTQMAVGQDVAAATSAFEASWLRTLAQAGGARSSATAVGTTSVLSASGDDTARRSEAVLAALEQAISEHTADAGKQLFTLSSPYAFYSPTRGVMSAARVKPISFDISLTFIVLAYMLLLRLALKGVSGVVELFSPATSVGGKLKGR